MTVLTRKLRGASAIRVLIVADTRFYLDGLAEILSREEDFEVIGTAGDLPSALAEEQSGSPNVVLLDMTMVGSARVIADLQDVDETLKVVMLGVPEVEREVITLAEAGVSGYVPRSATVDDLICAVRGELVVTPRIAGGLFRRVSALAATRSNLDDTTRLTRRELEIVGLIDWGLSNKQIASRL